jgi:hypothetical protein
LYGTVKGKEFQQGLPDLDNLSADVWSFFRLAGPFIARCPGGPTVSIAFWSKFCLVDFNRDFAARLIFLDNTGSIVPFER